MRKTASPKYKCGFSTKGVFNKRRNERERERARVKKKLDEIKDQQTWSPRSHLQNKLNQFENSIP